MDSCYCHDPARIARLLSFSTPRYDTLRTNRAKKHILRFHYCSEADSTGIGKKGAISVTPGN